MFWNLIYEKQTNKSIKCEKFVLLFRVKQTITIKKYM